MDIQQSLPIMMKSSLSSEDRHKAVSLVESQSPSYSVLSQLRRNYSSQALKDLAREAEAEKVWSHLRDEAVATLKSDPFMEDYLTAKLLKFNSFSEAMMDNLAESFQCPALSAGKWRMLFKDCYDADTEYHPGKGTCELSGLRDLAAVRERDPSATNLLRPFLYFKGYRAVQAHRISHVLWRQGRQDAALLIQSRMCELWSVDIHPAAVLGGGLFIDHATGVVVGETAVIGNNCSFLHGITLGSSGKSDGDRHPKLGNDVLVGCGAAILGNITIGSNAKIGAGSIVLRDIPCSVTAVGNPARIVGHNQCDSAGGNMDLAMKNVKYIEEMSNESKDVTGGGGAGMSPVTRDSEIGVVLEGAVLEGAVTLCGASVFKQVDLGSKGKLSLAEVGTATGLRFGLAPPSPAIDILFRDADRDGDGFLNYDEYQDFTLQIITFTARNPNSEAVMQIWEDTVKDSHSVCIYLIARARLDMDSTICGEVAGRGQSIDRRLEELKEDREMLRKRSSSSDTLERMLNEELKSSSSSSSSSTTTTGGGGGGGEGGVVPSPGSSLFSFASMRESK
jgi:serine O-acetyltransferase